MTTFIDEFQQSQSDAHKASGELQLAADIVRCKTMLALSHTIMSELDPYSANDRVVVDSFAAIQGVLDDIERRSKKS